MAAYCDMALLFFIETTTVTWSLNTRLQVFFALDDSNFIPTLFQLYSNFIPTLVNFSQLFGKTELFKITLEPCNYFKPLYIKYCSNFIVQKNQLNRAKKKKPNICEDVRPFPTSKRTSIKWWSNIDDLQVSE